MRNFGETPMADEQAEEKELSPAMEELYEECIAGIDREELRRKAGEIGPEGVREVLEKGKEFVGRNIRAFGLIGFTAVAAWAGGNGAEKPAVWPSEGEYDRAWAIVAADKAENIAEDVTANDLARRGYSAEQIKSLLPGARLTFRREKPDTSSRGGEVVEVQ